MDKPKYFKSIELLKIMPNGSINKIEFKDCLFTISGNYLIISNENYDRSKYDVPVTTISEVFNLSEIKSYKTVTK